MLNLQSRSWDRDPYKKTIKINYLFQYIINSMLKEKFEKKKKHYSSQPELICQTCNLIIRLGWLHIKQIKKIYKA